MGIERVSNNNEIQTQEVNRASNEQIEQNNAAHQRSAETSRRAAFRSRR